MEQINTQNTVEKKQWETPKASVISNDIIKTGTKPGGSEGQHTVYFGLFLGIYSS